MSGSVAHNPGFSKLVEDARPRVRECDIDDVLRRQAMGERFHLVDIREDHEVAVDRAEGAIHLSRGILEREIESVIPDREALIVLYCGGGYRSVLAAESLQKMGYRNVFSMAGGIRAWRSAGYPMEDA